MTDVWAIVGSSPSVVEHFERVCVLDQTPRTITSNGGLLLCLAHGIVPDVWFCCEPEAEQRFGWIARQCVTTIVDAGAFDQNVEHPLVYEPGKWKHARFSGLMCLTIALNQNPEAVHLLGMDGYTRDGMQTYDGRYATHHKGEFLTETAIGPFIQSCVDACPQTRFHIHGRPEYELTGANVVTFGEMVA